MKYLFFILFLSIISFSEAQTTSIPDANFEQELINLGYDVVLDGVVFTANINSVTLLNVISKNISDLTGIQDFTSLTSLDCNGNLLSSIDVSQNTSLTFLSCWNNPIISLDVTQNTSLTSLQCNGAQLTSIDVSQNTLLTFLSCWNNPLTSLDVTQNALLTWLQCNDAQLTSLDVSQNTTITTLFCDNNLITNLNVTQNTLLTDLTCDNNLLTCLNLRNGNNTIITFINMINNPNLTCIEVDNVSYSTTNWTNIDIGASFNTNCPSQCIVGIDELQSSSVSIHPNPTQDWITISLEERTPTTITIRNSLGQLLLSEKHPSGNEVVLDISFYPSGLYFLQVESDGEMYYHKNSEAIILF